MPYVDPVLYNALLQSRQGGLLELTGGHRVYPSSNCCISGNTVGVYKDPVPILEVDDQDVCTYESVCVSFSNSFSASSTLQLWSVDWGDGYTSNGAWPPAASVCHPAGGYILPGNYVIILTITDLLGATGATAADVYVADCWEPMGWPVGRPPDLADIGTTDVYAAERWGGEGYYTSDITANPPTWTQDNHGLDLERTIMMSNNTASPRLFGYGDGIWEYTPLPLGSGAWVQKYTEAQLATAFGHGADYNWVHIGKMCVTVNPSHEGWAWAVCYIYWSDGAGDDHVAYGVIYTTNYWSAHQYARIIVDLEEGVDFEDTLGPVEQPDIAYDEHADYLYVLICKAPENDWGIPAVATFDGWWRLYRSQDYAYTWMLAQQSPNYTWAAPYYSIDLSDIHCSLWIPYRSNTYNGGTVYWSVTMLQETNLAWDYITVPLIYYTHNFGLSRTEISDVSGSPGCALNILHGPWNSIHRVYGALVFEDTADGHLGEVWTFRGDGPAYGWTLFQDVAATVQDCDDILVMRQNGYALMVGVTAADPWRCTSTGDYDCQYPGDDAFDLTWVET